MEFLDVVAGRHSVRDFAEHEVPRDVIRALVDVACHAPSAMNEQPWHFHVVVGESRAMLGQVMAGSTVYLQDYMEVLGPEHYEFVVRWYTDLGGAPAVVVVTIPHAEDDFTRANRLISVGCAIENFLLAAFERGLAACNITFSYYVRDEIAQALEIPDRSQVVALIALGYPGASEPVAPGPRGEAITFHE